MDGHHRVAIANEAAPGRSIPTRVVPGGTDAEVRAMAVELNTHRRQLTPEAKRGLVADALRANPGLSNSAVAAAVGVSDKTVGKGRKALEEAGEIAPQVTRTGEDGKAQAATRRRTAGGKNGPARPAVAPSPAVAGPAAVQVEPAGEPQAAPGECDAGADSIAEGVTAGADPLRVALERAAVGIVYDGQELNKQAERAKIDRAAVVRIRDRVRGRLAELDRQLGIGEVAA